MSGKKINKNLKNKSKKGPIKEESKEEVKEESVEEVKEESVEEVKEESEEETPEDIKEMIKQEAEERKRRIVRRLEEYSDIRIFMPDIIYTVMEYFDCSCSYYDFTSKSEITYPIHFQRRENNYIFSFHCLRSLPINRLRVKCSNLNEGITLITYQDNDICSIKATWKKEFVYQ